MKLRCRLDVTVGSCEHVFLSRASIIPADSSEVHAEEAVFQ